MDPIEMNLSGNDEESMLIPRPVEYRKRNAVAGAVGTLVVMALCASCLSLTQGQQPVSAVTSIISLAGDSTAEEYKTKIHKKIQGFAHICKECRSDAKKYYGSKLDEVTELEKKCAADATTCDDVKKDMATVMDEVDGAWAGTKCPKEMPVSCKITSDCNPFPKKACAPHTCHPLNLLKSFGKNNNCKTATIECDGEEKVSLSPDDTAAEEYKQMIHKRIEGFAHICEECRKDAKEYYGAKLDEVREQEKKCEEDESTCNDAQKAMDAVKEEVDGAWSGKKCPKEMPVSCNIKSSCNPFPKRACAPHTCHPINLLKSFGKNNKCTDATMECDGKEVSLKDA